MQQDRTRARAPASSGALPAQLRAARPTNHYPLATRLFEQSLFAGPTLGFLAQVYLYRLSSLAPTSPHQATQQIIRKLAFASGHVAHEFYVTPFQNAVWWMLAAPACAWLAGIIVYAAWRGYRITRRRD